MVQFSVKMMDNVSFLLEFIIHLLYGKHCAINLENIYRERDMVLIPKELTSTDDTNSHNTRR